MIQISIAAYSGDPKPDHIRNSIKFIDGLIENCVERPVLILGGYWGLMKYIVDYSIEKGVKIVLIPPVEKENIKFPEKAIVVKTGASYRVRSIFIVRSGELLVVLGGASGSIQEITTAYSEGKDIYILIDTGLPTDRFKCMGTYDDRLSNEIYYFRDPIEMAREVCNRLRRL